MAIDAAKSAEWAQFFIRDYRWDGDYEAQLKEVANAALEDGCVCGRWTSLIRIALVWERVLFTTARTLVDGVIVTPVALLLTGNFASAVKRFSLSFCKTAFGIKNLVTLIFVAAFGFFCPQTIYKAIHKAVLLSKPEECDLDNVVEELDKTNATLSRLQHSNNGLQENYDKLVVRNEELLRSLDGAQIEINRNFSNLEGFKKKNEGLLELNATLVSELNMANNTISKLQDKIAESATTE